jgi:hypothetical protein
MSRCKASETGDPPAGWGVQAKRGQIPRNKAYKEVCRRASGPEGLCNKIVLSCWTMIRKIREICSETMRGLRILLRIQV